MQQLQLDEEEAVQELLTEEKPKNLEEQLRHIGLQPPSTGGERQYSAISP